MAKASDNQFPSVLLGEGTVPTSPGAGTQRIYVDTADHKLKRVNSSGTVSVIEGGSLTGVTEVTTPSSPSAGTQTLFLDSADHKLKRVNSSGTVTTIEGSGSGSTVKDPRWNVLSGQTTIDEFNDASLDAAWVRVDGTGAASGNLTWTENGDVLSAYNIGGDTTDKFHALLYPLSSAGGSLAAGDGVVTCVEMWAPNLTNNSFAGPVFTDGTTFGSGNQVWAELGVNSVAPQYQAFSWTGFGTAGTNTGAITGPVLGKTYIRLSMLSANTWRADYSRDGISWIKGSANLSKTLTPTHVGFFDSSYGTSTQHIASYEFIRRVSGVT